MTNITLAIPNDIYKEMKQFTDIRWSEIARKAIVDKIEMLKMTEAIAKKSKLTKEDIEAFSKLIKEKASKRFRNDSA